MPQEDARRKIPAGICLGGFVPHQCPASLLIPISTPIPLPLSLPLFSNMGPHPGKSVAQSNAAVDTSTHRRPLKRSRKFKQTSDSNLPASVYLLSLPFELIAEILIYTASPKDVLAVARCNKYLCTTLLRESSAFIWRTVRANCSPGPLPDPQAIRLTESAFAALVFDAGDCIACGKSTKNMFSSWSLRVRFCSRAECKTTWAKNNVSRISNWDILTRATRKALTWIPLAESPACFWLEPTTTTWPESKVYVTATMNAALAEYGAASSTVVEERHSTDITRSPLKMSFYVTLFTWRQKRLELERQVKQQNDTFGKTLAVKEGYVYLDLLNGSGTYQTLYSHRTKNLEFVTRLDYDVVSAKIEAEMISAKDRQERRISEATVQTNRAQIEQHYQRLLSSPRVKGAPLPSLTVFRAMPILDLLQSASASMPLAAAKKTPGVAHELQKDTIIKHLLASELARWRKKAEIGLGAALGIPEWKTARTNRLHPVARANARFSCSACGKVARPYKWDDCLDYEGVCKHECQKGKKNNWKVEQFVKDDKAVNAMTKLVKLCSIDVEDPGSFKALDDIGPRIRCLSCPAAIVMRPSNVPGHSHRHDEMEMSLLTQAEADALVIAPLDDGLATRLIGHDDYRNKRVQKTWTYGCRHCNQHVPPPLLPVEEKAPEPAADDKMVTDEQVEGEANEQVEGDAKAEAAKNKKAQKKQPKRFEFNGLRSHLKEKHSIPLPNDEDFYHISSAPKVDARKP
ncbi:hypothetical protein DFH07DRAFT_851162 [Mycena maculata]|uniref:F-box domain-containing protein n=1 Tax=Mycena maculata TaxID=230809 RepID=A0AAD7HU47_9AGAR|nr:hypothetical protein DFH07DRAFT_851162 [Mycena maculata]